MDCSVNVADIPSQGLHFVQQRRKGANRRGWGGGGGTAEEENIESIIFFFSPFLSGFLSFVPFPPFLVED